MSSLWPWSIGLTCHVCHAAMVLLGPTQTEWHIPRTTILPGLEVAQFERDWSSEPRFCFGFDSVHVHFRDAIIVHHAYWLMDQTTERVTHVLTKADFAVKPLACPAATRERLEISAEHGPVSVWFACDLAINVCHVSHTDLGLVVRMHKRVFPILATSFRFVHKAPVIEIESQVEMHPLYRRIPIDHAHKYASLFDISWRNNQTHSWLILTPRKYRVWIDIRIPSCRVSLDAMPPDIARYYDYGEHLYV